MVVRARHSVRSLRQEVGMDHGIEVLLCRRFMQSVDVHLLQYQ